MLVGQFGESSSSGGPVPRPSSVGHAAIPSEHRKQHNTDSVGDETDSNGGTSVSSPPSTVSATDVSARSSTTAASQTSINIFRQFLKRRPDGSLDAAGIVSPACYQTWLGVRKTLPAGPAVAFKRALCGHITAVDGRVPFNQDEEEAILLVLRKRERWECFKGTEFKFGESGFRAKGFHEKAAAGEALKSHPKKRAKSALQRLNQLGGYRNDSNNLDDAEYDEDEASSDEGEMTGMQSKTKRYRSTSPISRKNARRANEYDNGDDGNFVYPPVDEPATAAPPRSYKEPGFSMSSLSKSLIAGMHSTAVSFTGFGMSWLGGMMAAARLLLISRGWYVPAAPEQVQVVMARLNEQFPEYSITLLNFAETDPTQRIVSQNDVSIEYFGRISQQHGGFTGRRFVADESWHLFSILAELTTKPNNGQEVYSRVNFYVKGKPTLCHVWLSLDPTTHFLIERIELVHRDETR